MKITHYLKNVDAHHITFVCDYSPPRGADPTTLLPAKTLDADYICVAYNPGRRVRVDSALFAYALKKETGHDVIFNLTPRDKNKLALQTHLLGVQMLGLDNVAIMHGDDFTEKDLNHVKSVRDYPATGLIAGIAGMNAGQDYKGGTLKQPTDFCVGATLDLNRDLEREAQLAQRKVASGTHYFITQPIFDLERIQTFHDLYHQRTNTPLTRPIFYGVQVLQQNGVVFSSVPEQIRQDLEKGRAGTDIALDLLSQLTALGHRYIYLVAPIMKGGKRDYEAAQQVIRQARQTL